MEALEARGPGDRLQPASQPFAGSCFCWEHKAEGEGLLALTWISVLALVSGYVIVQSSSPLICKGRLNAYYVWIQILCTFSNTNIIKDYGLLAIAMLLSVH